jgi:hypothetical protein
MRTSRPWPLRVLVPPARYHRPGRRGRSRDPHPGRPGAWMAPPGGRRHSGSARWSSPSVMRGFFAVWTARPLQTHRARSPGCQPQAPPLILGTIICAMAARRSPPDTTPEIVQRDRPHPRVPADERRGPGGRAELGGSARVLPGSRVDAALSPARGTRHGDQRLSTYDSACRRKPCGGQVGGSWNADTGCEAAVSGVLTSWPGPAAGAPGACGANSRTCGVTRRWSGPRRWPPCCRSRRAARRASRRAWARP